VLRARGIHGDVRQVDVRLDGRRELDLGLFRGFAEAAEGHRVLGEVDRVAQLELVDEVLHERGVKIFAAEEGVAVGRLDLEHTLLHLQDRHIEGAATQVVHRDDFVFHLFHAVGEGGGRGLVDDSQHVQARDLTGVLGGLALRVVEVGWHSDDGVGDRCAEVALCGFLHLCQHKGADLARRVLLALGLDPGIAVGGFDDLERRSFHVFLRFVVIEPAADKALGGGQCVGRVGNGLALGRLPDEPIALVCERHHRRRRPCAFGVFNDPRRGAVHDRDARVCCSQVDADDVALDRAVRPAGGGVCVLERHAYVRGLECAVAEAL